MKIKSNIAALLVFVLSGCCTEADDAPVAAESKGWIPYQDGQQGKFGNDSLGTFLVKANLENASFEQISGKRVCEYEVERRILKLTDPATSTVSVQITLQSKDVYFGKMEASPNSEAILNLNDNYQTIHGSNATRYEFLPQVTLNGRSYQNVIHYSEGANTDAENVYQEYYFAKDQGLVAVKQKNNPTVFYLN